MDRTIELVVPGEPVGKQRPRIYGRHGVTPEKTVRYETLIRELFAVKYPGFEPLGGPLALILEAYLSIPKSESKKKRTAMAAGAILPVKSPDFDNLAKIAADALQTVAYRNDAQIAEAQIQKRYSETPRLRIALGPIEAKGDST
jgi:Holliday junction resolvase RusA-like endonuclease